jgi:hypothetical protein
MVRQSQKQQKSIKIKKNFNQKQKILSLNKKLQPKTKD